MISLVLAFFINLGFSLGSQTVEVTGKILSYDEKTVTIEQDGQRVVLEKAIVENIKEIKAGKTINLKVKKENPNRIEVPAGFKKTEQK